jgi:transcription antitermination protein NusB
LTRHEARACALQSLYQVDVGKSEIFPSIQYALEQANPTDADLAYVRTLVEGTRANVGDIDELLEKNVEGWQMNRIGRIELNILRLATYELMKEQDVDVATVINEAVDLGKEFGAAQSGKFVNGVLAKLLPQISRPPHIPS